jgi:hypothetical protein
LSELVRAGWPARCAAFVEQAVADGEGAGLVELDLLHFHRRVLLRGPSARRRMFSAEGPERRWAFSRSSSRSIAVWLRSRKVSGSSSSRKARSNSPRRLALVMARPPSPATTV